MTNLYLQLVFAQVIRLFLIDFRQITSSGSRYQCLILSPVLPKVLCHFLHGRTIKGSCEHLCLLKAIHQDVEGVLNMFLFDVPESVLVRQAENI